MLIGIDVALGISREYWRPVTRKRRTSQPGRFIDWLGKLDPNSEFFGTTVVPRRGVWIGRGLG